MDTNVFKVLTKTNPYLTKHNKPINIFDNNRNIKVQQRLVGHMALNVTSLAKAKRLFELEADGLAGFTCVAGMMNGNNSAYKMTKLIDELDNCQHPLQLTQKLCEAMEVPTHPRFIPALHHPASTKGWPGLLTPPQVPHKDPLQPRPPGFRGQTPQT